MFFKLDKMNLQIETYPINQCSIIGKTKEHWGEFSNMATLPIVINDVIILTTEALYQSLKYPDYPEIQKKRIEQKSPIAAKMVQKPFKNLIRGDWNEIKLEVMSWCLSVKFLQHHEIFLQLLKATQGKYIVEVSKKDAFWGAKKENDNFVGQNILGKLWMILREQPPINPTPPKNKNLKLFGVTTDDMRS